MPARLFMSYSHKDEALRDELETHLAVLRRQGVLEVWHDRKLLPGDHLDTAINAELERADVVLLLLSSDFLASDYCFGVEMRRAMERHQAGSARVIPVILRPCDWAETELRAYLATPTDGKAVTKWANADEAFLTIAQAIRRAVEELGRSVTEQTGPIVPVPPAVPAPMSPQSFPRTSNLALRKTFTNADRDDFLLESFGFMDRFFQGSLSELQARNPSLTTRHRRIDANSFTAIIYRDGDKKAACTIRIGGPLGGITYANGDASAANGWNESLSVEADDQKMYLRALGMPHLSYGTDVRALSQEGAAEYLWSLLIDPLKARGR